VNAIKGFFRGLRSGYRNARSARLFKEAESKVATYFDPKKTTLTESVWALGKVFILAIVVGFVVFFLVSAWQGWQDSNWAFHDRMTTVQGTGWQAGEYKLCVTVTRQELKFPLLLDCDESWKHDPKFFNVRFWGPIQKHERQPELTMHWKCRKNAEGEVAIICESEAQ
jgi:hypothetical protein